MDCFHKASLLAVRIYMRDQVRGHGMETGENRGIQEEYSVLGFSYWKPGRALLYIKKNHSIWTLSFFSVNSYTFEQTKMRTIKSLPSF